MTNIKIGELIFIELFGGGELYEVCRPQVKSLGSNA
jgi:hypothetical protein